MTVLCDLCMKRISIMDIKNEKAIVTYDKTFGIIIEALCLDCLGLNETPDVQKKGASDEKV